MAKSRTEGLRLPQDVVATMRTDMTGVADQVIAGVISEVPSYRDPFRGQMGRTIAIAVRVALDGFLDLASRREGIDAGDQIEDVLEAAYALGRGEARSGRTMDALAQAYRVGARIAWRELSTSAVAAGLDAPTIGRLAELVFAYIDELSDASVSGHAEELAASGRLRQRRLDRLAARLLEGAGEEELVAAADRADWEPPRELTAVVAPRVRLRPLRSQLDSATLYVAEDAVRDLPDDWAVALVPAGRGRGRLAATLADSGGVVGPVRPWTQVQGSYLRARQAQALGLSGDTDAHLARLVLSAEPDALADLRARVLAPLAEVRASTREKLTETLRSWLLHQGRRDEIAAALFVHPQTVRYRMGQLRELYGDRLTDADFVRDATIALA